MRDRDPQVIIILGSGLSVRGGKVMPSYDQEVRLTAGAELASRMSQSPLVVLCGGRVFQNYDPISSYAQRYLTENFDIPVSSTHLVADSLNTVDDVRGARAVLTEKQLQSGLIVSSEGHLVAAEMAKRCGYEFRGAEEVLEDIPTYQGVIAELRADLGTRAFVSSQRRVLWILRLLGEGGYRKLGDWRKINAQVEVSRGASFLERTRLGL